MRIRMLLCWLWLRRRKQQRQDRIERLMLPVLRVLVDAYPKGLTSSEIKRRTGEDGPAVVLAWLEHLRWAESDLSGPAELWLTGVMVRRCYRLTGPGLNEALAQLQTRGTKR